MSALFSIVVSSCLFLCFAPAARAQDHDARAHFRRGIEHFNEGNHDAALAEFQRAYEIAPAHQVLYNIARVHAARGDAVAAAAEYERYLEEGGADIAEDRRREVERALEVQRARIGRLDLEVSVDGATIAVDGNDVAVSPLAEPLSVTAGTVELEVRSPNHRTVRRRLRVAGGVVERLVIDLVEAATPGILRIESMVPDVLVEVDGEAVGTTPFDSTITLAVGEHRVTARRDGYRPFERRLFVDRGAESEVVLDMRRDEHAPEDATGALVLALPDARYEARIDGETVGLSALRALPAGRHRLELDVEERLPYAEVIDVRGGETTEIRPRLEWTPAARDDRASGASLRRSMGVGLTIGGVAFLGGGVSVLLWNYAEISETNRLQTENNAAIESSCPRLGDTVCDPLRARGLELADQREGQTVVEALSWVMTIAGGVSTVAGLILWLSAPSESRIDAAASATLDFVPLPGGGLLTSRLAL